MTIEAFFRWAAWLLVLAIAIATLSPNELRPTAGATSLSANLERLLAFTVVGGLFGLGYPKHRIGVPVLLVGIIGLFEVAQALAPGRHGRLLDGLLKAAGALLGLVLAIMSKPTKTL